MALEQTIKVLQAQNAQFQEMILNLTWGQEELKALLLEIKGKNDSDAVNGRRGRVERKGEQAVGAFVVTAPSSQAKNHQKSKRQFTSLYMTLAQALQSMLNANLITLRDPPIKPNTASPRYNPNARCAYHSDSPGHDTNECWVLKNKIQDMIDAGEIKFNPPGIPHVITTLTPDPKIVNIMDDSSCILNVAELTSPPLVTKSHLLQADLFPDYVEDCDFRALQLNGCLELRNATQRLRDNGAIMLERILEVEGSKAVVISSKTPYETILPTNPVIEPVRRVPKVICAPPTRTSLKGAKAVVEEGGCTVWGQMTDVPYKSDKFDMKFSSKRTVKDQVNVVQDADSDCYIDGQISPYNR